MAQEWIVLRGGDGGGGGGLPRSFRYHLYTRRDGRLWINRLEIDRGGAILESVVLQVHYEDEAHGIAGQVRVAEYELALDGLLFGTIARVWWERSVELPQASISKAGVKIRCRGGDSGWMWSYPVGTDSLQPGPEPDPEHIPAPVRTMGHRQYQLAMRVLRAGGLGADAVTLPDAYETVKATEPQTFYRAYAEISNFFAAGGDLPPIDIPGGVSRFEPGDFDGNRGLLTFTGTAGAATVMLRVTGDAEVSFQTTINEATLAEIATKLADAINGTTTTPASLLGGYFSAHPSGATVELRALQNYVGTLSATIVADGLSLAATGITPAEDALNIMYGRKYVAQLVGTGGRSAPSPLSITTGPVRGRKITIRGLPAAGADADDIRILAAPDGQDEPYTTVAEVGKSSLVAVDTTTDTVGGTDADEICNVRDGKVTVYAHKQGAPWLTLTIPSNKQRSDFIDASNLGRIEENTIISADLQYELDVPPTLDKPGRPCDVRLVIE